MEISNIEIICKIFIAAVESGSEEVTDSGAPQRIVKKQR